MLPAESESKSSKLHTVKAYWTWAVAALAIVTTILLFARPSTRTAVVQPDAISGEVRSTTNADPTFDPPLQMAAIPAGWNKAEKKYYVGAISGKAVRLVLSADGSSDIGEDNKQYFKGQLAYDASSPQPLDFMMTLHSGGHMEASVLKSGIDAGDFDSQWPDENGKMHDCDGRPDFILCGGYQDASGTSAYFELHPSPPFTLSDFLATTSTMALEGEYANFIQAADELKTKTTLSVPFPDITPYYGVLVTAKRPLYTHYYVESAGSYSISLADYPDCYADYCAEGVIYVDATTTPQTPDSPRISLGSGVSGYDVCNATCGRDESEVDWITNGIRYEVQLDLSHQDVVKFAKATVANLQAEQVR